MKVRIPPFTFLPSAFSTLAPFFPSPLFPFHPRISPFPNPSFLEASEILIVTIDDIDHMRRVVAYCKRHLAQEEKAKQDTDSKSYKSLKNWGHDALKN